MRLLRDGLDDARMLIIDPLALGARASKPQSDVPEYLVACFGAGSGQRDGLIDFEGQESGGGGRLSGGCTAVALSRLSSPPIWKIHVKFDQVAFFGLWLLIVWVGAPGRAGW